MWCAQVPVQAPAQVESHESGGARSVSLSRDRFPTCVLAARRETSDSWGRQSAWGVICRDLAPARLLPLGHEDSMRQSGTRGAPCYLERKESSILSLPHWCSQTQPWAEGPRICVYISDIARERIQKFLQGCSYSWWSICLTCLTH